MTEQTPEMLILETTADVTPEILEWAEQVFTDWFDDDEPIDWEHFIDRFADPHGFRAEGAIPFDIESYDNPAIRKLKRHVRAYRNS